MSSKVDEKAQTQEVWQAVAQLAQKWGLEDYDAQTMYYELMDQGMTHEEQRYLLQRMLQDDYSCVTSGYLFVQRFWLSNFPRLPPSLSPQSLSVPSLDFPRSWLHAIDRPRFLAWREKVNGVSYVRRNDQLIGDETLSMPPIDIMYGERVMNTLYILKPYTIGIDEVHDGIRYKSHEWRTTKIERQREGIILLASDGNEYRVRNIPTVDVASDSFTPYVGEIVEVQLQGTELVMYGPRWGGAVKTLAEAAHQLSSSIFFDELPLDIIDPRLPVELPRYVYVQGKGDKVALNCQYTGKYSNPSSLAVSAKALIQDKQGRILLVKEGTKGWDLPGGKADAPEEAPSQIIRREVREELGLELEFTEWKVYDARAHSITFLFHKVIDDQASTEWKTSEEVEQLKLRDMAAWFPDLYEKVKQNGPIDSDIGPIYVPHETVEKGQKVYQKIQHGTTPSGRLVQKGTYACSYVAMSLSPSIFEYVKWAWENDTEQRGFMAQRQFIKHFPDLSPLELVTYKIMEGIGAASPGEKRAVMPIYGDVKQSLEALLFHIAQKRRRKAVT